MNDKSIIFVGLVIFLVLVTFPTWYTLGFTGDASPPDLELPEEVSQCVEDTQYMTANHMKLLREWRNAVVREGRKSYTSADFGEQYEMSLTNTCLECHTNREGFCTRCHEYVNVVSLQSVQGSTTDKRGIRCWDCHVEPQGDL